MMELVFAFLMTMPGVPFVYYGEEIGMQFVEGLPSKEGGYPRTGSRTPMQWGRGKNAGFSTAAKSRLYLPVDSRPGRPNVADQQNRGDSLLSRVRRLTALRRQVPTLQADAEFIPVRGEAKPPFVYMRKGGGRKILVALNPIKSGVKASVRVPGVSRRSEIRELLSRGVSMQRADGCVKIEMSPTSFAIVEIL
jgi:maltose alpha-D-glucosyltransferase/alpha-amylase